MIDRRVWLAAMIVAASAALACSVPDMLGGDGVSSSSPLYGLERTAEVPVDFGIREPSDLAFDPETNTFWTVSDHDGTVHRLRTDGTEAGASLALGADDLEGITLDPKSGHLFVVDEATSEIVEATRDGKVVNRYRVAVPPSNSGLEGIALDRSRDGFVLVKERGPAELLFVDRKGAITGRAPVTTQDLSAVTVSPNGESILVMARFEEAVLEVDRKGRTLNRLPLNAPAIEGLAFDDRGRLVAVADLGANARGMLYVFSKEGKQ